MNADDTNARFHVGSTIAGRYRVERPIGEGAMGAVALARHVTLDETVAIKFLRPELRRDPVATARLAREAKALARIKSDHVARVLDVGVTLSVGPYMVMEYLEGVDLGEVLETEGPLPVARVVECMLQVCEALTVAHTAGITHRDIKPQNLFLARHGRFETLKILDFGIAEDTPGSAPPSGAALSLEGGSPFAREPLSSRDPLSLNAGPASASAGPASASAGPASASAGPASASAGPASSGALSARATTSPVYGTPSYMAPERVRNDPEADHRSDIWSVGVVLHELVTGRAVFDADSITETCARIVSDEPIALEQSDAVLPPSLRAIVARCLERDPARRYQSVEELAAALAPLGTMHERFRGRSTGAFSRRLLEEELAQRFGPASVHTAAPPGTWQHAAAGLRAWGARVWESALPRYAGFGVASVMLALIGVWLSGVRWMAPPPSGVPIRAEPAADTRGGTAPIVESVLPLATPAGSEPASATVPEASSASSHAAEAERGAAAQNDGTRARVTPSRRASPPTAAESTRNSRHGGAASASEGNEARGRVRLVKERDELKSGQERSIPARPRPAGADARGGAAPTDVGRINAGTSARDALKKDERVKKTKAVPPWLQPYQSNAPRSGAPQRP